MKSVRRIVYALLVLVAGANLALATGAHDAVGWAVLLVNALIWAVT